MNYKILEEGLPKANKEQVREIMVRLVNDALKKIRAQPNAQGLLSNVSIDDFFDMKGNKKPLIVRLYGQTDENYSFGGVYYAASNSIDVTVSIDEIRVLALSKQVTRTLLQNLTSRLYTILLHEIIHAIEVTTLDNKVLGRNEMYDEDEFSPRVYYNSRHEFNAYANEIFHAMELYIKQNRLIGTDFDARELAKNVMMPHHLTFYHALTQEGKKKFFKELYAFQQKYGRSAKVAETSMGNYTLDKPIPGPIGSSGSPSSSMGTTASRVMQQHMPEDNDEFVDESISIVLKDFIQECILEVDEDAEQIQNEASGCAAVAGYTEPKGKKKLPHWKASADAFARAKKA